MLPPLWLQKPQKEEFMGNIGEKIERDGKQRPNSAYSLPSHIGWPDNMLTLCVPFKNRIKCYFSL